MAHERIIKYRVMLGMVNKTKEIFQDVIDAKIMEPFEFPQEKEGYQSLEVVDNLVLPKLDAYAEWLKNKLESAETEEEKDLYCDNFMVVARLTNNWLRAVDAGEDESYLL